MSGGNTIGRFVGQSPPEDCEPEESNPPLAELFEKLKTAKELFEHIKSLVETFSPKEKHEGTHSDDEDHHEVRTPETLAARLIELGALLRPTAASMEGTPPLDAQRIQEATRRLVDLVHTLSGEPGMPVDRRAIDEAAPLAARIVAELHSDAERRQAVDNAMTLSHMRDEKRPAMEILEKIKKTFEAVKGILESLKKLKGKHGDGTFIRKSE
jgi:hypothetical protein